MSESTPLFGSFKDAPRAICRPLRYYIRQYKILTKRCNLNFNTTSMESEKPGSNELSKVYYRIADVAAFVGVPQSTLRYWEKEFPHQVKPMRNAGNIRYYTPEQVETLKLIKFLVHTRGMKIDAVRRELRGNVKNVSRRLDIVEKLEEVRAELKELLSALEKRR